jgi:SAM-dependent methyltransferase
MTTTIISSRGVSLALLACFVLTTACRGADRSAPSPPDAVSAVAPAAPADAVPRVVLTEAPAATPVMMHDPTNPSIDCPLRKHGIDPTKMRPFEQVEEYIAFLERPDRAVWQKPDEVVAALGLAGNETVADLGAGSGYFTFRIARALPEGKVVALDTEPEMIRHIHHTVMSRGVVNVASALVEPTDPGIPPGVSLVFICDVLHHVADREAWLAKLAAETAPGTRLVLIEFKEGELPEGPPAAAKIPRAKLVELVTQAGFVLELENTELLPYQVFLVFRRT